MRVEIRISPDIKETYAIICCNEMTDEIQGFASSLESGENIVTVKDDEHIVILRPREIFMIRVEAEKTIVYCRSQRYTTSKRLYELEKRLGRNFMRISKSTIINLNEIASVEPSFNSMMTLILKNGCKDYISRKYLPDFKKYLGL